MATTLHATLRLTATDRWSKQSTTDTVRVRWSRNNRRQSAILTREALRHRARVVGPMGWLEDCTDWQARVIESDIR